MTIFAVLPAGPSPKLAAKIAATFQTDFLRVNDYQWLISTTGTAQGLSDKLGIISGEVETAIVFSTAGYFGRAPTNIWEWIKAKLEAPTSLAGTGSASGGSSS